jgi:hypothetical protein
MHGDERDQWATMLKKGAEQVHLMWSWEVENRPGSTKLIAGLQRLWHQLHEASAALTVQVGEDDRAERRRKEWEMEAAAIEAAAKASASSGDETTF